MSKHNQFIVRPGGGPTEVPNGSLANRTAYLCDSWTSPRPPQDVVAPDIVDLDSCDLGRQRAAT